jgi:hypothetical protein
VRHNERSAAQLKGDAPPGERAARCLNRVTQEETQEVTQRKIVWGRVTWEETRK